MSSAPRVSAMRKAAQNMRRAMSLYNGDYTRFLTDPVSLSFLAIAVLWVAVPQIMKLRGKQCWWKRVE
ncbi:hypothetical protein AGMMS50256_20470 [Betaproteobacteria bacterium]|nr:hypothetical protein AGMMS50256_20470 [Betaproteobacteria bacterium]